MDRPTVIFDDSCNLCRTVIGVASRRGTGQVHFVPSASREAARHYREWGLSGEAAQRSMLLLKEGEVRTRSDAVLGLLLVLRVPRVLVDLLKLLPRWVRDAAYNLVARNRFRLFGRKPPGE